MRALVVGAGITGLSIAYNLASRGVEVVVLEQSYPGSGLSMRAIGGIHSQWDNEHDIKLAKKSRSILERLPSELNFNILFRQDGCLMVARDEEDFDRLKKNATLQHSLGIETTAFSRQEIGARYPFLSLSSMFGGVFSSGDGVVHPFSLVFGYWSGLNEHGGSLLRPVAAKRLQAKGSRIRSVETDRGIYEADVFVISSGVGTRELLRSLAIDIPTRFVRYEMLATEPLRFFLKPMIQVYPNGICLTQSLRGEVVCQIPMTETESNEGNQSTFKFLEVASSELTHLIPSMQAAKVLRPWVGLCETTSDSEPVYGRVGYENLWVAFADSGKGMVFAPAIGELISESVLSGGLRPELVPYSPARFLSTT